MFASASAVPVRAFDCGVSPRGGAHRRPGCGPGTASTGPAGVFMAVGRERR